MGLISYVIFLQACEEFALAHRSIGGSSMSALQTANRFGLAQLRIQCIEDVSERIYGHLVVVIVKIINCERSWALLENGDGEKGLHPFEIINNI